ncbi:hypothetical protein KEM55_005440 [Ascosphaera atra]|nr:hypothetical protein KEM55_005440 [Ascosphaera atra]
MASPDLSSVPPPNIQVDPAPSDSAFAFAQDNSPSERRQAYALTGRQEHYLKRELISLQVKSEIAHLNSPTALRHFGPPFRCDAPRPVSAGKRSRPSTASSADIDNASMTAIENSELPILRYVFSHHVRNFPFLDKAREKEFWQDKLQVFLESFASKHISPSEDRHEQTKRRKIAIKCEKLLELMMVSALRTSSGYEERIQFSEIEVIDRGANEQGLHLNAPEGVRVNGWDVNVAGVTMIQTKGMIRSHSHAQFILRVKHGSDDEVLVGRRFGDFSRLLKRLQTEFPGKVLPTLPRKNKTSSSVAAGALDHDEDEDGEGKEAGADHDADSIYTDAFDDFFDQASVNSFDTGASGYTANDDNGSGSNTTNPGGSSTSLVSRQRSRDSPPSRTRPPSTSHLMVPNQTGIEANSLDEGDEDREARNSRRLSFHRSSSNKGGVRRALRSVKSNAEIALTAGGSNANADHSRSHGMRKHRNRGHSRSISGTSASSNKSNKSESHGPITLYREQQRVSLRAFLRTLLQHEKIASSKAMIDFLTASPISLADLTADDKLDMQRRREMDTRRIVEQKKFFEVARKRARELDVYMEKFRRSVVEENGLSKLFGEIKEKNSIAELSPEYVKFVEWARIEVAAILYHMFLADDNAPELFAQAKRIHSLVPYTLMKNVIRLANPAAVMGGVLDIFLAQPFGSRSLIQRILGMAMGDGIRHLQRGINVLTKRVTAPPSASAGVAASSGGMANVTGGPDADVMPIIRRLQAFVESDEEVKQTLRQQAEREGSDVVVVICMADAEMLYDGYCLAAKECPSIMPPGQESGGGWFSRPTVAPAQARITDLDMGDRLVERVFNGFVAWVSAVEDDSTDENDESAVSDLQADAVWFAWLKQLLKMLIRHRDKRQMLEVIEEPVTVSLFRDLFTIFYEPLVRVYKSANVYNSITDFAAFFDDTISVIEKAQRQDVSADPNVTVQSFIDLCARHQDNFFKFVHEVHKHDNGLFDSLMAWIEDILDFLRHGPRTGATLDMNALFEKAAADHEIDRDVCMREIDSLIRWHEDRKRWHHDKTRQKMAAESEPNSGSPAGAGAVGGAGEALPGLTTFSGADFGLHEADLEDLAITDEALASESEGASSMMDVEDSDEDLTTAKAKHGLITAERRRRAKKRERERLRSTAGEPAKPPIKEIEKLKDDFTVLIREALAS